MANVVVVGSQWGDEGKGKIVDLLTEKADFIIRFQGGNNAGHTLVVGDQTYALHLVPSGILHPTKFSIIDTGVVVNPDVLISEIKTLHSRNIQVSPKNLAISDRAHLIMPYHEALDAAREELKGKNKIGTTGRGIGPAYEDKAARFGLRMADLSNLKLFEEKIAEALYEKNHLLKNAYGKKEFNKNEIMEKVYSWAEFLNPYITDTWNISQKAVKENKRLLFEGAQGVQLDIDYGTYPFVTSSNPITGGINTGAGLAPNLLTNVIGLVKAYCSRVGSGPFPTELFDETGDFLRKVGAEFGTTTGRPRRCGWLDMVALKRAAALCGLSYLAVTKLDILSGLKEIKIATGYLLDGKEINFMPADHTELERCQPIYETMPGWDEDISKAKKLEDLPSKARAYLDRIAKLSETPVGVVSVGPDRKETIVLQNFWEK